MWPRLFSIGERIMTWFSPAPEGGAAWRTENRQWPRFAARPETTYHLVDEAHELRHPARVRDISQGGIRLRVDQPHAAGRLLHIALPAAPPEAEMLLACVVHSTRDEEEWDIGCSFIRELTPEELQRFL
jgi:hypothetical protein